MIPRDVAAAFPSSVRRRGDEYFAQERVEIGRVDPTTLFAVVKGSVPYLVQISAERNLLSASCACPFSADNGICKHIWATFRAADQSQKLQILTRTAGKNPGLVALRGDSDDAFFGDAGPGTDLWGPDDDIDADEMGPPIRHN